MKKLSFMRARDSAEVVPRRLSPDPCQQARLAGVVMCRTFQPKSCRRASPITNNAPKARGAQSSKSIGSRFSAASASVGALGAKGSSHSTILASGSKPLVIVSNRIPAHLSFGVRCYLEGIKEILRWTLTTLRRLLSQTCRDQESGPESAIHGNSPVQPQWVGTFRSIPTKLYF
jgi:hypothetical protein